jgi:hypothetical protein
MTSPLEKVLRLSEGPKSPESSPDDIRVLVQAARVALTGACGTDDPAVAAELVYAAAATVEHLATMLLADAAPADLVSATMTGYQLADEPVGLSVLTAEGRRKAKTDGYTIAGSEDYPIPDKAHLSAAVARYKQGKHAGHPAGTVKAHILKHARRLGVEVDLMAPAVLSQLRDGEAAVFLAAPPDGQDIPMDHAPFDGTHSHAHRVSMAHDHEHTHHGDNSHGSSAHGQNQKEKAWAPKGQSRRSSDW